MLKLLVISGFLAIMLVAAPAVAQSAAPAGDQSATPPADQGATPPLAGQGATTPASTAKALIASCQSDAESKGLKGADRKSAVHDCVAAQNPKVANRMQCRQQAKAQGKSGDDVKAFVKDCMSKIQ